MLEAARSPIAGTPCVMRIPHEAFGCDNDIVSGSVVLMVDRLVGFRERLVDIIRQKFPNLQVHDPPVNVKRPYACVRVPLKNEATLREGIKEIGRERGTRGVSIKVVPGTLLFDSPRD